MSHYHCQQLYYCSRLLNNLVLSLATPNAFFPMRWPTAGRLKSFPWLTKLFVIWLLLPSPGTASYLPPRYTPTIFKAHALSSRSVHHSLLPLRLFLLVSLEYLFPKPFPWSVFSFSSQFKHHHLRKPSLTAPCTELGPPAAPMVTRVQRDNFVSHG